MMIDPVDSNSGDDPTSAYYSGPTAVPPGMVVDPTTGQLIPAAQAAATAAAAVPPGQTIADKIAGGGSAPIARGDPNNATQPGTTSHGGSEASFPAQQTPPQSGGGGGGGGGGGTGGGTTGKGVTDPTLYAPFTAKQPDYVAPQVYTPPTYPTIPNEPVYTPPPLAPVYTPPPAFSYGTFQAPTLAEAQQQPGYQFGLQQGEQALQQSAAAQGLLRTGGTLKDILNYGQQAATQNYQNVYNNDLTAYTTNRGTAEDTYNTNYKTQYTDPYANAVSAYNTNVTNQYTTPYANAVAAFNANVKNQLTDPYNAAQNIWTTQTNNAVPVANSINNYNADAYKTSADIFYANENNPFAKYATLLNLGAAAGA